MTQSKAAPPEPVSAEDRSTELDAAGSVQFDYIKSNYFRVIYASGVIGGVTPQAMIHMALYSERQAIPKVLRHEILADGTLKTPPRTEGRQGYVREVDVDVMLDIRTAQSLVDWLNERIADLEKHLESG